MVHDWGHCLLHKVCDAPVGSPRNHKGTRRNTQNMPSGVHQPCNAIFLGVSSRYGGWFKNPEKSSAFLEPPVCFFYPMNGLVQKQAKRLAHSIHWFIITIPIKIAISKLENSHSFIWCPTPALENWPHLERDLG